MPILALPAGVAAAAGSAAASTAPSWLSAAGASAAGNLLSGAAQFGGLFGSSSDGFDVSENLAYQRKRIKAIVDGAKRAGIHPLFALGASSGAPATTFTAGQADADRLAAAGQNISAAADAMKPQGKLETAQIRAVNASASRDEAAAMASMSQMRLQEQEALNAGMPPDKYITVYNNFTGKYEYWPNKEFVDVGESVGTALLGRAALEDVRNPATYKGSRTKQPQNTAPFATSNRPLTIRIQRDAGSFR